MHQVGRDGFHDIVAPSCNRPGCTRPTRLPGNPLQRVPTHRLGCARRHRLGLRRTTAQPGQARLGLVGRRRAAYSAGLGAGQRLGAQGGRGHQGADRDQDHRRGEAACATTARQPAAAAEDRATAAVLHAAARGAGESAAHAGTDDHHHTGRAATGAGDHITGTARGDRARGAACATGSAGAHGAQAGLQCLRQARIQRGGAPCRCAGHRGRGLHHGHQRRRSATRVSKSPAACRASTRCSTA